MKKFKVIVHFEGAMNYEVEAENEEEAKEKAESLFGEEDERITVSNICDVDAVDALEVQI